VAQTLLSVPVRLGNVEEINAGFLDFLAASYDDDDEVLRLIHNVPAPSAHTS
jgi:hypothetical protein